MSTEAYLNATGALIRDLSQSTLLFAIEVTLGSLGILGNAVVCYTILRARSMHNLTNYLILNLAVADLCVCLCLVAFSERLFLAFSPQGQLAGSVFCVLCVDKNGSWFFAYAAVLSLTLVTLERYTGIVAPLRYPRYFSGKKAFCYVILVWVLAFFVELPYIFVPKYSLETQSCYYDQLELGIKVITAVNASLFTFVGPLAGMLFAYWRIIRCLKQRAADLMKEGTQSPARELLSASRKVVKTLLIVTVVFIVLWVPIQTCCSLLSIFPILGSQEWFNNLYSGFRTVGYLNSVLNVIVYSVKYKQFRTAARAIFCPSSRRRVAPSLSTENGRIGESTANMTKISCISN